MEMYSDAELVDMPAEKLAELLRDGKTHVNQVRRVKGLPAVSREDSTADPPTNHSVLQPWVMSLGWKLQSILLSGLRGPDDADLPAIKAVNRWLRTISQNNADPSKDYMRQDTLPEPLKLCDELEWRSCHYVHHFADALRVVSIFHPGEAVRIKAWNYHFRIAEEIFHFVPENDAVFLERHLDKT